MLCEQSCRKHVNGLTLKVAHDMYREMALKALYSCKERIWGSGRNCQSLSNLFFLGGSPLNLDMCEEIAMMSGFSK